MQQSLAEKGLCILNIIQHNQMAGSKGTFKVNFFWTIKCYQLYRPIPWKKEVSNPQNDTVLLKSQFQILFWKLSFNLSS